MWTAPLLLALAVGAWAQVPIPCAGPASFTGRFRAMDRERQYFVEGKMYYDEANKRIREIEFEDIDKDKMAFDKLKLYGLDLEYRVDLKTRQCNVTTPRRSWRPYGVPPFSRFQGEASLGGVGLTNEQVTVSIFEGEFDEKDPFFVIVTEPDCFVVEMGFYSNSTGFEHREFYDVVSGITDPMAFVPPQDCV